MLHRAPPQEDTARGAIVLRGLAAAGCAVLAAWIVNAPTATAEPARNPQVRFPKTRDAVTIPASSKTPRRISRKKTTRDKNSIEGIADYGTQHFLMHTDLNDEEAEELLDRLETMLDLISKYWGRNASGVIEMFVVKDLRKWPEGVIPQEGLSSIRNGAGLTVTRKIQSGDAFLAKSLVYAIADHGTPQHEVVHAYCGQTFGRTGPLWYSEGMAEMGQYWRADDLSVNASRPVIRYLRESPPRKMLEIVNAREITGDSWQNYAWRWALCHLLAHNMNYHNRFQSLGLALLTNQPDASFEHTYGPMAQEISFEYQQFLRTVDIGYRADLCSWDWKAKFRLAKTGNITQAKIDAGKGWQPSRLILTEGEEYEFSASGKWNTADPATGSIAVDADGDRRGRGRLIGALLTEVNREYQLSEPFELGRFGSFRAPGPGNLYLRCQDDWSSIADNRDSLIVKLKLKSKGPPLPAPKDKDEEARKKPARKAEADKSPPADADDT